MAFSEYRYQN